MKPDIQPLPEMPEYPLVEIERLRLQVESLSRLAAMLASAVKCGEEWTDTLEREYRAAIPSASGGDEARCACGHAEDDHVEFARICAGDGCECVAFQRASGTGKGGAT